MVVENIKKQVIVQCKEAERYIYLDIKKAQLLVEEAYLRANDLNDEEGIGWCQLLFGMLKYNKGEFSEANEYFEDCLYNTKKNKNLELQSKVLKYLGDLRREVNDYDSALEYYLTCLDVTCSSFHSNAEKARVFKSLGDIYKDLEQYSSAIEYYKESRELCVDNQCEKHISVIYSNIAECYLNLGHLDKAKEYILISINRALENISNYDLGYAYMVYAKYHYKNNNYSEAKVFFNKSIKKFDALHQTSMLAEIMVDYSVMLYNHNELELAEEILNETSLLLLNEKNFKVELKVYLYLAKIYEITKKYKKALEYFKVYNELKTINDETWKTIKVKNIINKYEHLRADMKVKELTNTNRNLVLFSNLGREITSTLNQNEIIEKISKSIFELIKCDAYGVGFINKKDTMDYTIDYGKKNMQFKINIVNQSKYLSFLVKNSQEFIDNDFSNVNIVNKNMSLNEKIFDNVKSIMTCPLIVENKVIGIVNCMSYNQEAFRENDLEILKILSSYISIALHNSIQSQILIETNKELKELTEKDGLTKVFNRYALDNNIKRIVKRGMKFEHPFSIFMIDIDYFKQYNDNYGHLAGDRCLVEVSKTLKKVCSKEKSYIYRYGGDEFLAIILNQDELAVRTIAEKMRKEVLNLRIEHKYSKCAKVVSLTLGIVTITKEVEDYEYLFTLADKALYKAKEQGRNNLKQLIY